MALKISQITFELKIPNINKLENFCSPEVIIQSVPWKILVGKELHGTKQWLAIYLHCIKEDLSPDWSYAAISSFKLKPFGGDQRSVECHVQPFIFDRMDLGFGTGTFVEWNDVFDPKKNFVKNNMIKMDITIEVADPSDVNKSELIFEHAQNNFYFSKFRLNVTNIQNLMAVRSPSFTLQKVPWYLTVCKDHSSNLVVRLHSNSEISWKKRMVVRLVSTQKCRRSIQQVKSVNVPPGGILSTTKFVSLNKLLTAQNGFVNNNSILIEVEIISEVFSSNDRSLDIRTVESVKGDDHVWMECAICLERMDNQEVSSLLCGHLFCSKCIKYSLEECKVCPLCKAPVNLYELRRVYLPFISLTV
ncbi:uncharacterized protein LOC129566563 [Sitodiplosis mosellana]|uniref:uncharacterized protein LOC129566563 n=1 Tax=Sitodiplosis mosellana TaxID=263140 RepID=UPI002444BC45|nr:uncharacterized protein LOC129566563 [Sitodiplosis mosellana]